MSDDSQLSEQERARRLLEKVRAFADDLDDDERELFAVLIGPGVEALTDTDEVSGFGQDQTWEPGSLRDRLSSAVSTTEWQIVERR